MNPNLTWSIHADPGAHQDALRLPENWEAVAAYNAFTSARAAQSPAA